LIEKFSAKKRVIKVEDKRARKYLIQQLQASGYLLKEISELLSISRVTLYDAIKEDLS